MKTFIVVLLIRRKITALSITVVEGFYKDCKGLYELSRKGLSNAGQEALH
jgi:hypothetical protein